METLNFTLFKHFDHYICYVVSYSNGVKKYLTTFLIVRSIPGGICFSSLLFIHVMFQGIMSFIIFCMNFVKERLFQLLQRGGQL